MLKITSILLVISTCVTARDVSSLLSNLLKKSSRNSSPLVLVLDKNSLKPLSSVQSNDNDNYEKRNNYDSSLENDESLAYILQQLNQLQRESSSLGSRHRNRAGSSHRYQDRSQNRHQDRSQDRYQDRSQDRYQDRNQDRSQVYQDRHLGHQHTLPDKSQDRNQNRNQDRHQHNRYQSRQENRLVEQNLKPVLSLHKEPKSKPMLRSDPVYKSLLTLRNSLRCGARNECKNECDDNYKGKKKNSCEDECEDKFECDEPKDECEESEQCPDTCEEGGSTRGVTLVTEKPGCTRC